ncbi:MAG: AAA family ATPase [Cyclobacteriaceae bacterium]|jgi:SpoVK/Ycf46/Vps4 family AAA+-type ATPase
MNEEYINGLREALNLSPENNPLRLLLADALIKDSKFNEAEEELKAILIKNQNHTQAKLSLAKIYFAQGKFSTSIVILEEIDEANPLSAENLIILSKSLLRNNEVSKAIACYKKSLLLNPSLTDEELDQSLRSTSVSNNDVNQLIESLEEGMKHFEKPSINFSHVGGMQKVKSEIEIKIIQPLLNPDLFKKYGKKIGGGILMYGPPGCGKTHMARATAGQIKANFISVGIHDVLNMWLGNSEKQLHDLFELARRQAPCIMFFDEIDALGASRTDMRQSSSKMLINQFLNELDGVKNSNDGVLILGATNAPWHLDGAFRRPGRFDRIIFVHPPDLDSRESILKIQLEGKPVSAIDYKTIAKKTEEFSGADLMSVIDRAVEDKLREAIKSGNPHPIETRDLLKSALEVKPSTKEWFTTARNYALYSNESGSYDDILEYLKIKK